MGHGPGEEYTHALSHDHTNFTYTHPIKSPLKYILGASDEQFNNNYWVQWLTTCYQFMGLGTIALVCSDSLNTKSHFWFTMERSNSHWANSAKSYLFRVRGFLPFYFLGGTAYFMINQMHNGRSDLFNAGLTGAVLGGITGVLAKGPKAIRPYAVLGILLSCTAYGIKIKQQSSSEGYRIPFEDRTEEENTFARLDRSLSDLSQKTTGIARNRDFLDI